MNKSKLLFIILLFQLHLQGQTISSLGTKGIVELECSQSKTTNTFIVASMERISTQPNNQERTLIHRSIDNGMTWSVIDSIEPRNLEATVADPVLAHDDVGNFYLIVMRVISWDDWIIDLELYKSIDDGLSWKFISKPYHDGKASDYPQLIAKGNGELFLVYNLADFVIQPWDVKINFTKSVNGGETWSTPHSFLIPQEFFNFNTGPDISWGKNKKLFVTFGSVVHNQIYHFTSDDFGDNWSNISISKNSTTISNNITKPISHTNFNFAGVLSHEPHETNTPITYHSFIEENWNSIKLSDGAYAQGYITNDGNVHVIYNQKESNTFNLKYVFSENKGKTFSTPMVLYSAKYTNDELGEYQSLTLGNDGNFYLAFCDWADNSKAKMLVFSSRTTGTENIFQNNFQIWPNPASDKLNIKLENPLITESILLISSDGRLIKKLNVELRCNLYEMDISNISKGMYSLIVNEINRVLVQKLIVL